MSSAADLSTYDKALKQTWTSDKLVGQFYDENPFLDDIRKTRSFKVGKQAITPIVTDHSGSYSAMPSTGGTLNSADTTHMTQAVWNYTHHSTQIKIDSAAIDGTSGDALSVANVIDTEVSGSLGELRRNITRQFFQNGDALACQCGVTSASATIVLNTTAGQNALERGWLHVGQYVDIGTTASEASLVDAQQVTSVSSDVTAPTITTATSATTTSSHYVSIANARSGTTSYESNGLQNIVSTSATLGTLTVASNPKWQAAAVDSTSQALDLSLLYTSQRKVHQQTGKAPNYVLTGLKQADNFYQLLQSQVRFASESEIAAGAVDKPKWNGMSINIHPDCQNEYWYNLTKENLFVLEAGDPYWANSISGKGKILDWIQGTTFFGSALFYRINLATDRRNAHSALTGLT
jgi:hypothetical protein